MTDKRKTDLAVAMANVRDLQNKITEVQMSRMERIKSALTSTVAELRSNIEKSHASGKIPSDYSLGFANSAIFFEHRLMMREGQPKLYSRTTSIGVMPVPTALNPKWGNLQGAEEIYENLRDSVILAARNFLSVENSADDANAEYLALEASVEKMDKFIDDMESNQKLQEGINDQEAEKEQSDSASHSESPVREDELLSAEGDSPTGSGVEQSGQAEIG
jgi:hypothetical protein